MKHTPGPWEAGDVDADEEDGIPIFARNKGKLVYYVAMARYMGTADHEQARANARLIAAAPDLLAALEMARAELVFISEQNLTARNLAPLVTTIETAIAKAKEGPK